jgi:2-keto-4-pentenoate hydratase
MLGTVDLAALADALRDAERDRAPIPPLPSLTPAQAYEIQLINIRRRSSPVVGYKVGLTSAAMQEMLGVREPDYGHLLADMRVRGTASTSRYCYPRVEIEVAFILGADLPGAECTESDVLAATEAVAPAIELIDSRIAEWDIRLTDTIADNGSSAGFVLGDARVAPADVDLRAVEAWLNRNGIEVARGRSDAVLGDPATAVAWLARALAPHDVRLRAGHVVLPGAMARAVDAHPGDEFIGAFEGLGDVRLTFSP